MAYPIPGMDTPGSSNTMSWGRYVAPRSATPTPLTPQGPGVDSADVAKTAALLKSIVETADSVPAIDQARVAWLQQAVVSGTVQANPQQIARSIAELEALLA
ncbi:MAG TPA: flagellar biosynthesis anti-sigma factor FlgM [Stellaceae bacterium]|nr:flagellar biosynthesis anti-sigma factor FlgM [Stellaceae bacterium]